MANRTQLKTVRKNRHNLAAGRRNRSKRKKTVVEKRRLRLLGQDTLLNENLYLQKSLNSI